MKTPWTLLLAAAVLLAVAVCAFLLGRHSSSQTETATARASPTRAVSAQQSIVEVKAAIALATQHVAGEVLKVELEREDGRFVYEVKVLAKDGRVREVELDATDGSLIEIEDE